MVYEQEFKNLGENPPQWCNPDYKPDLPLKYTKKRAEMLKR